MRLFPTTAGVRPRLACELRAGSVVAARAEDMAGIITGSGLVEFAPEALAPGLSSGNIADAATVGAAMKRALESAGAGNAGRNITLIVPDAAVRVSLLDFETLPSKPTEALPVVRFRLKKLMPFDVDTASVSYQIMSSTKDETRVLAVAMPMDVLSEYEAVARQAGFEPGAVLPSTLAALAGVEDAEASVLLVNASSSAVTAAIVQSGVLLLHRPVEMQLQAGLPAETALHELARETAQAVSVAAAYFEDNLAFKPEMVYSAGPLGAEALSAMLEGNGLTARELVRPEAIAASATGAAVGRRGLLAGVRGALRS